MKQELLLKEKLPEGWKWAKFENVVDILDNMRVPINTNERTKIIGNIPYYGANGQAGWIDKYIFDEELVLLAEDGGNFLDKSKEVAYLITGKSWVNNHAHVLRGKNGILLNKYLYFFLNTIKYNQYVSGSTRLKLNQSEMKKIPILLPPLPVQQQIVVKLDAQMSQIEGMKKEAKKQDEKIDFLFDSLLINVFEKLTNQIELGSLINNIQNGIYKPEHFRRRGIKLVRMYNIESNSLNLNDKDLQEIELSEEEKKHFILDKEDILLSRVNSAELVGKCGMVGDNLEGFAFENMIIRIKTNKQKLIPEYLGYFFLSPIGKREIKKITRLAINQASINNKDVKTIKIRLPSSITKQENIAQELSTKYKIINDIKQNITIKIGALDQFQSSILNEVFGKYDIPDVK